MSNQPAPIDYGHAAPRRRRLWWIVAIAFVVVLVVLFQLLRTDSNSLPLFGSRPTPIVPPSDPWQVTIPVGGRVSLPGGRGTPVISVPSISNGEPMVFVQTDSVGGGGPLSADGSGASSFGSQMLYYRLQGVAGNQVTLELSLSPFAADVVPMSAPSTQPQP